jgi:hypothetical protein
MFDPSRHYPVQHIKWDRELVQHAIQEIADDALTHLDRSRPLPLHPLDDYGGSDLYTGMTGVLWALTYLHRVHAIEADRDFTALLDAQLAANATESQSLPHPENASYLFGELPILMLQFQGSRDRRLADQLFEAIAKNTTQPVREFMWGSAGSMLGATFLHTWTAEERWREVFLQQAERLLREWERIDGVGHLWAPDLYGAKHNQQRGCASFL